MYDYLCRLFDCTHRIYESIMLPVCLHTQIVWERYVICFIARAVCMRAFLHLFDSTNRWMGEVCHLFDCTHRMYESGMSSVWLYTQDLWELYIICLTAHKGCMRAVCHLLYCTHRMYKSGMSSGWLHTPYVLERYLICLTAHTECTRAGVISLTAHIEYILERYVICLPASTEFMGALFSVWPHANYDW